MDPMGQEDIACMMMLNCFLDTSLKAKLGAVKTPTLDAFNIIIESHEAGKKAASINASTNSVKGKGDESKVIFSRLTIGRRIRFQIPNKNDTKRL